MDVKKQMVDKLSIILRDTPDRPDVNFCYDVAKCFQEINKVIPNKQWGVLWELYYNYVYKERDVRKQAYIILQIDRLIYETTGIKTIFMETMEKLKEICYYGVNRF